MMHTNDSHTHTNFHCFSFLSPSKNTKLYNATICLVHTYISSIVFCSNMLYINVHQLCIHIIYVYTFAHHHNVSNYMVYDTHNTKIINRSRRVDKNVKKRNEQNIKWEQNPTKIKAWKLLSNKCKLCCFVCIALSSFRCIFNFHPEK